MYEATATATRSFSDVARGYHELTKPGITLFVGITAAAGYVVNAGAAASATSLLLVVLATMLMSSGAATLNQVAERQLDARMSRTMRRPIPAGHVSARSANTLGWSLTAAGTLLATLTLPPLVLFFLLVCHASYVYWYTPLKVRTVHCTIVGAIPGAFPVLAGAAAAGMPNMAAIALTGLLFTWQIPHFMAIGWLMRDDYARAGFEMLPVVDASGLRTARVSLLYAVATMGFAVLVTRFADVGVITLSVIHTAAMLYMFAVVPFLRTRDKTRARRLFFASLVVLPVMLTALMLGLVF
jgi:protoheme IX farnesyltransferase